MTAIRSALADALGGRYVLERELGRGGMATVYLARGHYSKDHGALHACYCEIRWDAEARISVKRTPRRR